MKILEWLPRESACDFATRVILYNIVHLELAPGSEVSSSKLSETLSLSRMPVREALTELSRMGLVDILPQRGSYISKIDYNLVEESEYMRLVLEIAITKLACKGVAESYLTALKENLESYRRVGKEENYDRIMEIDNEFHRLIFASVNKSWIYTRLKGHMVHFDRLRMLSMSSIAGKTSDTLKEHEDILYAITRHDSEMAEMMVTRHLSHSLGEIDGVMEQYPDYFVQHKEGTA